MDVSSCVDSIFSVLVKECDEIFHLGRDECFEFVALLICLRLLEEKSCRRYSFSREDYFMSKSDNSAMKNIQVVLRS